MSSRGTVTYGTARELARLLRSLANQSAYHVPNTMDFIQRMKTIKLQQDECISSYDVMELFRSVPLDPVSRILKEKLEEEMNPL